MDSKSNFFVYLIGFVIVIAGLGWVATMAGVPPIWVAAGALVLLGIGILSAVKRTQARAVPEDSNERGVRRELEG
jgi:hypothetical protein